MMPDDLSPLSLCKNEVKDSSFMLMSSVIIFSEAITSSSFGLFVHCGCLIYQLSVWRVEFLCVATHKQWTFLGYYLFYWEISNLSLFGCFLKMKCCNSCDNKVFSFSLLDLGLYRAVMENFAIYQNHLCELMSKWVYFPSLKF